jgi:hypothetical protein
MIGLPGSCGLKAHYIAYVTGVITFLKYCCPYGNGFLCRDTLLYIGHDIPEDNYVLK